MLDHMKGPLRRCTFCDMKLPLEAFTPHSRGIGGLSSCCKACNSERASVRKHGVSSLQKGQLADAQDGCAICGLTEPGRKGWVVDHDHACCPGDPSCAQCRRGILCLWCNNALGYAHDDPEILRRMADYIELRTVLREVSESESDPDPLRRSGSDPTNVQDEQTNEAVQDVVLSGSFAERGRAPRKDSHSRAGNA